MGVAAGWLPRPDEPLSQWVQPTMPNATSDEDLTRYDELNYGIEVEYPVSPDPAGPTMTRRANSSSQFKTEWRDNNGSGMPHGGSMGGDPTVGAEITSPITEGYEDAASWYRRTLAEARDFGYPHEPTGLMGSGEGSTAGLHLHLSPLTRSEARDLYEMSTEPWMKVFVCSSITTETNPPRATVFRQNYCDFRGFDGGGYAAVRSRAGGTGHYEWRLPEPMTADHFDMVAEFLHRFKSEGRSAAETYARNLVDEAHEDLTAVQRYEACGFDFGESPDLDIVEVSRAPVVSSREFFWDVYGSDDQPYIYRVRTEGDDYYAFETFNDVDTVESEAAGVSFDAEQVVYAEDLSVVDSESERDAVRDALENPVSVQDPEVNFSDSGRLLAEAMGDNPP